MIQEVLQRRLEPWRRAAQWPAIGSWERPTERIIEADPLTTTQEVPQEFSINHPVVVWRLKHIGNVKKLSEWLPHQATTNRRESCFEVSSSLALRNNKNHFLIRLCCATKTGFIRLVTTSSLVGWRRSSKALPKAKICTKNKSPGRCLVVCWPSDPLQLSESQRNHNIWEVCSANRWDASKTARPNRTLRNQHFKSWTNFAIKFCPICYVHLTSHQLTVTSLSISTTFGRETASLPNSQQDTEMISKRMSNPETAFYTSGINISHWQKCIDCHGSYFD